MDPDPGPVSSVMDPDPDPVIIVDPNQTEMFQRTIQNGPFVSRSGVRGLWIRIRDQFLQ